MIGDWHSEGLDKRQKRKHALHSVQPTCLVQSSGGAVLRMHAGASTARVDIARDLTCKLMMRCLVESPRWSRTIWKCVHMSALGGC